MQFHYFENLKSIFSKKVNNLQSIELLRRIPEFWFLINCIGLQMFYILSIFSFAYLLYYIYFQFHLSARKFCWFEINSMWNLRIFLFIWKSWQFAMKQNGPNILSFSTVVSGKIKMKHIKIYYCENSIIML